MGMNEREQNLTSPTSPTFSSYDPDPVELIFVVLIVPVKYTPVRSIFEKIVDLALSRAHSMANKPT